MTDREFHVVDDLTQAALDLFLEVNPATILLTGGDTPRPLYERLATLDYPWADVEFFFSDERCVPPSDPRSNFGIVDETLFSKLPDGRWYGMDGDRCDAASYEDLLHERFGEDVWFDFAIYGMGPDGHTASLYPARPEKDVTDAWVVEVPEAGWEPFVPRVSLTVPALSSAALGVFMISGQDKRENLGRLLAGEDIPAARMRPRRLVILADHAAGDGQSG